MPSAKNSFSLSGLRLPNGSTAIDLSLASAAGARADLVSAIGIADPDADSCAGGRPAMKATKPNTETASATAAHTGKPDFDFAVATGAAELDFFAAADV